MAHVYRGEHTFMDRMVRPVEKLIYRLCGIDETREMGVSAYAVSLLVFNLAVLLFIYIILRLQGHLPLNPAHVPDMSPTVAFNTAVSFTTNTNWQVYVPEPEVSYLAQMLALARENFVSAAVGMAVASHSSAGSRVTRATARQLLGRHDPQLPLRAAAALDFDHRAVPRLARRASCRTSSGPTHAGDRSRRGSSRGSPRGPFASQESNSRSWAPTAAAPYNANSAQIPMRTRRRFPQHGRDAGGLLAIPGRLRPTRSAVSPVTRDRGGRCSRRPWSGVA